MGILNGKNKDGNLKIQMANIKGMPYEKGILFITLDKINNQLIFKEYTNKKNPIVNLSFDKITSLSITSEDIIKSGNTIGRAVTGGVLFGGAGAVVGALSARDKTHTEYYRVINYVSDGKNKSIVLKSRGDIHENKFFKQLSEIITPKTKINTPKTKINKGTINL